MTVPSAHRIAPSSFDPNDSHLTTIDRPAGWRWESCERALTHFASKFLLSRLPLFWQIESPLNDVCRSVGVTVFHNDMENMPVGGAAVQSAAIDTVLTTAEDAHQFVAYLLEKNIAIPRNWFLIHPAHAVRHDVPASLREPFFSVVEETHEYPGVPTI